MPFRPTDRIELVEISVKLGRPKLNVFNMFVKEESGINGI
jgi:hypothetical protein